MIVPVILCGGSGTRLWPLSTPERPKQFLPLVSDRSLFQETLLRLEGLAGLSAPIVICNAKHRGLVADQLGEIGVGARAIVLEPEGRNTAPAIGVAAGIASIGSDPEGSDPGPCLLVLPADHVIADGEAFRKAVTRAVAAAEAGRLVTFGVVPTRPETGYGYIEQGGEQGDWSAVARFVEKPNLETAIGYLESGRFFWNSGMFVFGARTYLGELARHAPAIHAACEKAVAASRPQGGVIELGPEFLESPSDSIDYAVMEKTESAAVVPLDAGWNDVGSWEALHDILEKDSDGNVLRGDIATLDITNNFVIASRKVALLGIDNVIVIEGEDGELLIMKKDRSQDLKRLLEILADKTR